MKFIYIMSNDDKKELMKRGFTLLKEDPSSNLWVFENKYVGEDACFDLGLECAHILSDVLTF